MNTCFHYLIINFFCYANVDFIIDDKNSLWYGEKLYDLYKKASTPYEWHKPIFDKCKELGIVCFSTPFDLTAVDFLEELNCPIYKIASFENGDIPLLKRVAKTKKPVTVVSNGVDTTFFHYKKHAYDEHTPTCLFVGNFAWAPNREAVHQLLVHVWPAVLQRFPQAKLTIVGKQFPAQMQQFVTSSVSVKDSVTDIRDAFDAHDVLLAPMGIGGGTKFKILEAFASGTSVISTKEGVAGIGIESNVCQIAQTPEDFVSSLASLYANPAAAVRQTALARTFVEKTYDWDRIATIQDHVWRDAV